MVITAEVVYLWCVRKDQFLKPSARGPKGDLPRGDIISQACLIDPQPRGHCLALGSHQWLIYPSNTGSRGKKLLTQAPGMKSLCCSKQSCPLYVPSKNVALRSGSGEGRRLSFINSTAGVLPVRWLIMLLVNYGESCRLILGTVSFLQYMVLCTHPPTAGSVFTSVVVRPAWLYVTTEFRYSFTPSPQHKHWRQCLSKSISVWQRCLSLRTLQYAGACLFWSSLSF